MAIEKPAKKRARRHTASRATVSALSQRPVSKPATLTVAQAKRAVKAYLAAEPA